MDGLEHPERAGERVEQLEGNVSHGRCFGQRQSQRQFTRHCEERSDAAIHGPSSVLSDRFMDYLTFGSQ
jgi:hypothetical protein